MKSVLERLKSEFQVEGNCGMVHGDETLQQMAQLIKTPRGVEHCAKHELPTLDIIRELKSDLETLSTEWHIDKGDIQLKNPEWAILVGDTKATINCDTLHHVCHIVLLHGTKATIQAEDYSVVAVDSSDSCAISISKSKTAKVIL